MAQVRVGDISLYVHSQGHGDPALLHPGLGYASWCWKPLMDRLADRYRLIALDTRGAGQSDKPEGEYSIDMFADDAAGVVAAMDLGPVHFVGHSMGGFVAQRFAARHPALTRTVALIATHPGQPGAHGVPPDTLALWEEASSLDAAGYARATFATSFRTGWAVEHAARFEEFLAARLEHPTPPDRWRAQFDAGGQFADSEWPLEEINSPGLILHGTDDKVVPYANTELFLERLSDVTLASFEGGGHNLPLEAPDEVATALAAFWQTR